MRCTHCGGESETETQTLFFHRADTEISIELCEYCLDELLSESGIQMNDK